MNRYDMEIKIRELIKQYAPSGTKFAWDNATRRFGCCRYKTNRFTGEVHDFRITISYPLASRNDWEVVKRTVLHEIAHARTPNHGHDAIWRRECRLIGGDGERCYRNTEQGGDVVALPFKYIGVCPVCGVKFHRNRLTQGARTGYHCRSSAPIVWRENGVRVA